MSKRKGQMANWKQVQSKERLKSEETEKIRTTENKNKRKDAEEKDLENNLEKRASHI